MTPELPCNPWWQSPEDVPRAHVCEGCPDCLCRGPFAGTFLATVDRPGWDTEAPQGLGPGYSCPVEWAILTTPSFCPRATLVGTARLALRGNG